VANKMETSEFRWRGMQAETCGQIKTDIRTGRLGFENCRCSSAVITMTFVVGGMVSPKGISGVLSRSLDAALPQGRTLHS